MAASASSSAFNMSNLLASLGDVDLQLKSVTNAMALEKTNEGKRKLKGVFDHLMKRKRDILKHQKSQAKSMMTRQQKAKRNNAMKRLNTMRKTAKSFSQSMGRHARAASRSAKREPNVTNMDGVSYHNMGRGSQYGPRYSRTTLNAVRSKQHPYGSTSKRSHNKKIKTFAQHVREQQALQEQQNML